MRDILLLLVIMGLAVAALRRAWIGVILWTWISLMNPHSQFGWEVAQFPVALVAAGSTLIGLLATRERHNPFHGAPVWALVAFVVWTCITLPFSFYVDDSQALWVRSLKIFLMVFVSIALIDTRRKLDWFVGIMVFSLGFYGLKGGIFTIATGGNFRVWGPGGFIEGNNELALALVMTIPLVRYLQLQAKVRWHQLGLGLTMAMTAITVLGTFSRGALLALGAMVFFLWLKGEGKLKWAVLFVCAGLVMLPLMSHSWFERMDTIGDYEQDESAQGRINAWHMAWNLARSNFFGGGFSIYTPDVFRRYAPNPEDLHAAHSIYFQVLGEHGFVGLGLFLLVWATTWATCRRTIALARKVPELSWASDLCSMVQVGLIGYLVGGSFLSLAWFDLPYDMMACVAATLYIANRQLAESSPGRSPSVVESTLRHRPRASTQTPTPTSTPMRADAAAGMRGR